MVSFGVGFDGDGVDGVFGAEGGGVRTERVLGEVAFEEVGGGEHGGWVLSGVGVWRVRLDLQSVGGFA